MEHTLTSDSEWGTELLDVASYLARIGHTGTPTPDEGTLRELHRAHMAAIPFENLDIALGRAIRLDLPSLQRKLVSGGRGGYCYEHTLLFAALLDRLGYRVRRWTARIHRGDRAMPSSHAILGIDVADRTLLADVGFGGGGPIEPIPLRDGTVARQGAWRFRLDHEASYGAWVLRSSREGTWRDLYSFTTEPRAWADYAVYNYYFSTNDASPFVGRVLAQRNLAHRRDGLDGRTLSTVDATGRRHERRLTDGRLPEVLRETFGIALTPSETARLLTLV